MPDYGVNTANWSPLPWSWAAERLSGYRNYWIVTASADGRPHALPVWGVWDEDEQRFGFSCAPGSRKARNLAVNPRLVVAGDDTVECISLEGLATTAPPEQMDRWIELYLAKYLPMSPGLDADFIRSNNFLQVTPERAFGIIEREAEFSTRATRWTWPST